MKSRKLGIALLLMLALVVTSGTFAYWASSVTGNNTTASGTVTIGEGGTATTAVTVSDQTDAGTLVPYGRDADADPLVGDTEYVLLTFPVTWSETTDLLDGATPTSTLAAVVSAEQINGNGTLGASYVITDVRIGGTTPSITDGGTVWTLGGTDSTTITLDTVINVYVLVQLGEPTQADYSSVANQNITFTVTFTVS